MASAPGRLLPTAAGLCGTPLVSLRARRIAGRSSSPRLALRSDGEPAQWCSVSIKAPDMGRIDTHATRGPNRRPLNCFRADGLSGVGEDVFGTTTNPSERVEALQRPHVAPGCESG